MDPVLSVLQMIPGAIEAVQAFYDSPWMRVISSVALTAGLIAAATPNKADNMVIQFIRDVIEWLGLNFGHAKSVPTEKK